MSAQDAKIPEIEPVEKKDDFGSWGRAVPQMVRVASPWTRFAHRFSMLADKVYMSPDHCLLYLARRVGDARLQRERMVTWWGRIYNVMTGARPATVDVSGAVLAGVLEFVGNPIPDHLDRGEDYRISFDLADRLLEQVTAKAAQEGMLK
ncbi:hypothetical protein [Ruegeria jejuensis]|uniref:hypothetical protein n=1 Tax=Ruegeria jejuensis TaxID=3233338 RepID=UPI00355AD40E